MAVSPLDLHSMPKADIALFDIKPVIEITE